jgi:CubicO group peptidase (beta-lactamase class C family)
MKQRLLRERPVSCHVPSAKRLRLDVSVRGSRRSDGAFGRLVEALADRVGDCYPPAVALEIVDADGVLLSASGGYSCIVGELIALEPGMLFDLASLTKVVAAVPVALALVDEGRWRLEDRLQQWLPDFPRADVTLWNLLTHTSGLPAHEPFYQQAKGERAVRRLLYEAAAASGPPGPVLYSDLGFMLLGWAASACAGERFDRLFAARVARPLGLSDARYRPLPSMRRRTVATELDGDQRTAPGLVWGTVHDGNAYALGGVSGHAGLFAPVGELSQFLRALLHPTSHPVLSAETIAGMASHQAGAPPLARGLGWRLHPAGWGDWSPTALWHTGFTGTSLLLSPDQGIGVVLAANGVHPHRRPQEQDAFRAQIHTLVAEAFL